MKIIRDYQNILLMSDGEKEEIRDAIRMAVTVSGHYLDKINKTPERWDTALSVEKNRTVLLDFLEVLARE